MTEIVKRVLRVLPPRLHALLQRCYQENTGYNRLARRIGRRLNWTVGAGPFAGMKYDRNECCGRILPKLLGSYEKELWPVVRRIRALPIRNVINIGCAEGYYAVGLARMLGQATVFAFDTLPRARNATRSSAQANGVAGRVAVFGTCNAATLAGLPPDAALLVVDCEGAEIEILDPERAPELSGSWMLVELHDFLNSEITPELRRRFSGTHEIEIIHMAPRDPSAFGVLTGLSPTRQAMALDEDRQWRGVPTQQEWAFLTPKKFAAEAQAANGSSPLVTVVVPVFNKRPYIADSIRSVLAQSYSQFELLIIDDGSTDGFAAEMAAELRDPRVRIVRQSNAGEGAARNRGLREMRGELAAFLDADDTWLPHHLDDIVELAFCFPEAGWFATGYRSVFRGGFTTETTGDYPGPALVGDYFAFATGSHPVHISSMAIRKTLIGATGGFVTGEAYGADLEFYARAALQGRLAYNPAVSSVYHHQLPNSAMSIFRWKAALPPVIRTLDALAASRLPSSAREYARWVLREYALSGLGAHQKPAALEMLRRAADRDQDQDGFSPLARYCPAIVQRLAIRASRSRFFAARERRFGHVVVRRVHSNAC